MHRKLKEMKLILPFCSDDEARLDLTEPFNQNGHTYATDGRTIVEVSNQVLFKRESQTNVSKVMNFTLNDDDLVDMPKLPECVRPEYIDVGYGAMGYNSPEYVRLDGRVFNLRFLHKLSTLPELKIEPKWEFEEDQIPTYALQMEVGKRGDYAR